MESRILELSRECVVRVIATEQALDAWADRDRLIHHSDRGTQCLSICHTERLQEAGIDGSVGSADNSYDSALAESMIGL